MIVTNVNQIEAALYVTFQNRKHAVIRLLIDGNEDSIFTCSDVGDDRKILSYSGGKSGCCIVCDRNDLKEKINDIMIHSGTESIFLTYNYNNIELDIQYDEDNAENYLSDYDDDNYFDEEEEKPLDEVYEDYNSYIKSFGNAYHIKNNLRENLNTFVLKFVSDISSNKFIISMTQDFKDNIDGKFYPMEIDIVLDKLVITNGIMVLVVTLKRPDLEKEICMINGKNNFIAQIVDEDDVYIFIRSFESIMGYASYLMSVISDHHENRTVTIHTDMKY